MADKKVYIGVEDLTYDNGVKLYDVAIWNEYGTDKIPPRPAFREGAEIALNKNKKQISAFMINMTRDLLNTKGAGKKLIDTRIINLLGGIGRSAVAATKEIIRSGSTVANAPATVKKKGFDHPLFHHGELLENVSYVIGEDK